MKRIFLTVILLATVIFGGCGSQSKNDSPAEPENQSEIKNESVAESSASVKGDLKISMLNVGQGDAILIQTGKQTVLIDTSDTDERELLAKELEKLSVTKIDKLILTHPHADHIGNAKVLINPSSKEIKANPYFEKVSVAEVYDNGIAASSPLYKSYMKAIESKKIAHKSLTAGDTLDFGNNVKFQVLYPTKDLVNAVNGGQKSDPNNESVVGKLTYKKFSMIFTGDAEKKVESEIWADNDAKILKCDIINPLPVSIKKCDSISKTISIIRIFHAVSKSNKQKPINRACTKECSNIGKSTFPSAFALIIEEVVRQKSAKKWQTIRDVNTK